MRLTKLIAAAPLGAALATAAVAGAAPGPPARATLVGCRPAPLQADRSLTVAARMARTAPGQRLAIRIELLRRLEGGRFERVAGPGLGEWKPADPDVDRFRYEKQITNLEAPAAYRALVSFRWTDAAGGVVRRAQRRTAPCRQPDFRADLRAVRAEIAPAPKPRNARYAVLVRNTGAGPATGFDVALSVGGVRRAVRTVPGLPRGSRALVTFFAPACAPGEAVQFSVDPDGRIAEANEADNVVERACPS